MSAFLDPHWITTAFAAVNSIRVVFYLPQIVAVARSVDGARDIALSTWAMWALTNGLGTAYGMVVVGDTLLAVSFALSMLACCAVIVLALAKRMAAHARAAARIERSSAVRARADGLCGREPGIASTHRQAETPMRAAIFLCTATLAVVLAAAFWVRALDDPSYVDPGTVASAAKPPPLLGADGTPQPAVPGTVPADPSERTQAALYATRVQAEALESALDGAVVWVEVDCCDAQFLSVAIERVDAQATDRHLALDAPVFVSGKNLRRAALVPTV
ncbi:MAG: hypothetical protein F9K36_02235 [Burkholderiaceae bacterium]|nr:MAG: hypothetical protein F9K36_02235 [Burkholderiaceae bacterium]